MHRGLITLAVAFLSGTSLLAGCNTDSGSSEEISTKQLENAIHEKLKEDIDPERDIDVLDLNGDGKEEYIIRYKTKNSESPLRIAILSEEDGKPVLKDEIKNVGEDFDEIQYIDINNNGKLEIVAGFKVGENVSKGISIYEYNDGETREIFEEYYSKYILKDINSDNTRDIVIIKEKEKEDSSFAYLYTWKNDKFENVKKVEIDSTLDTEDDIYEKLLED